MRFVAFKPEHMMQMKPHMFQQNVAEHITWSQAEMFSKGEAYTLLNDKGEPISCAGLVLVWESRGMAWAYFTNEGIAKIRPMLRFMKDFLAKSKCARIEAMVPCDDPIGHRWLENLGFECEAPRLRKFWPDGGDQALYAKVK